MWCSVTSEIVLLGRRAAAARAQRAARARRSKGCARLVAAAQAPPAARRARPRRARQVDDGQRRGSATADDLHRLAAPNGEGRAQRPRGAARSRRGLRASAATSSAPRRRRRRDVVGGSSGLELVEEPEALLREGERRRAGLAVGARCRSRPRPRPPAPCASGASPAPRAPSATGRLIVLETSLMNRTRSLSIRMLVVVASHEPGDAAA